jgi:hypothetical protein
VQAFADVQDTPASSVSSVLGVGPATVVAAHLVPFHHSAVGSPPWDDQIAMHADADAQETLICAGKGTLGRELASVQLVPFHDSIRASVKLCWEPAGK